MNKIYFILGFAVIFLSSCSDREPYYEFQELKDGNWAIDEVLHFEIDTLSIDLNTSYDISIEITNNVDYQYQNLWLFSEYNKDDSTTVKNQNEYILADEFGKWRGAGFASLFQSSHTIATSLQFKEKRTYDIYVRHGMQDKILHGIEKVGIKISKTKE